jgi:hypothetical protein
MVPIVPVYPRMQEQGKPKFGVAFKKKTTSGFTYENSRWKLQLVRVFRSVLHAVL